MRAREFITESTEREIAQIQYILASETHFFVLANKKEGKLGYYLFSIDIKNPFSPTTYYINWDNKLDIGNCDMQIVKEKTAGGKIN